jgi:hypothetical protein
MTALFTIFLVLGILYFIKNLGEPAKAPGPIIVELKMPDVQRFESPSQSVVDEKPDEDYYGPPPTHEQRRITLARFVEFFKRFPESPLKEKYPQQANLAAALVRYDNLQFQLENGLITQEAYDEELEIILPLIDISEDLPE